MPAIELNNLELQQHTRFLRTQTYIERTLVSSEIRARKHILKFRSIFHRELIEGDVNLFRLIRTVDRGKRAFTFEDACEGERLVRVVGLQNERIAILQRFGIISSLYELFVMLQNRVIQSG